MCGMSQLTQTGDWLAYFSSSAKKDFKERSLSDENNSCLTKLVIEESFPSMQFELLFVLLNCLYLP